MCFKSPGRLFYQANRLISVFQRIWKLLHALSIQKRNIQCWFLLNLLLNLRSPRDYVVRSSVVRSRLWYVLDRQLLNG